MITGGKVEKGGISRATGGEEERHEGINEARESLETRYSHREIIEQSGKKETIKQKRKLLTSISFSETQR